MYNPELSWCRETYADRQDLDDIMVVRVLQGSRITTFARYPATDTSTVADGCAVNARYVITPCENIAFTDSPLTQSAGDEDK